MLTWLLGLAMIMHGFGHATGFLDAWSSMDMGFADRPWVFSANVRTSTPLGRAWGVLWLVAMICMAGAGLGLLFGADWWPMLALVSAAVSLVSILPWWNTVVPGAKAGAAFDIMLILALTLPWADQFIHAVS